MDEQLRSLIDQIQSYDFEEEGNFVVLESVQWKNSAVALGIEFSCQSGQRWVIDCEDVRDVRICDRTFYDLCFETGDHPVLLPFNAPPAQLHFSGKAKNVSALAYQLIEAHRSIVEDWFDCMHFFNRGPGTLGSLLEGGHGLLADGPEPLMNAYADVVRNHGVGVSSLPSGRPLWWNGEYWERECEPLAALVFDRSYVISPAITARRV